MAAAPLAGSWPEGGRAPAVGCHGRERLLPRPSSLTLVLLREGDGDSSPGTLSLVSARVVPSSWLEVSVGAEGPASHRRLPLPQMRTGCTTSAAWPGWTSTRWSPPPTTPLSKSGQSPTEDREAGPRQGLALSCRGARRSSRRSCDTPTPARRGPQLLTTPPLRRVFASVHIL